MSRVWPSRCLITDIIPGTAGTHSFRYHGFGQGRGPAKKTKGASRTGEPSAHRTTLYSRSRVSINMYSSMRGPMFGSYAARHSSNSTASGWPAASSTSQTLPPMRCATSDTLHARPSGCSWSKARESGREGAKPVIKSRISARWRIRRRNRSTCRILVRSVTMAASLTGRVGRRPALLIVRNAVSCSIVAHDMYAGIIFHCVVQCRRSFVRRPDHDTP